VPVTRNPARTGSQVLALLIPTLLAVPVPAVATPGDHGELRQRVATASARLEVVVERYNALREDLDTTVAQISVLKRRIGPLQEQVERHQARIGEIASAAYMASGTAPVNALLRASDAHNVINNLLILNVLAQDQQREIDALTGVRRQYEMAQTTLRDLFAKGREQQRLLAADRAKIEGDIAVLRRWQQRTPPAAIPSGSTMTRAGLSRSGWVKPELTGPAAKVLDFALAQLGKAYQWAAEGPDAFDCSGLVTAAWRLAGVELPHHSGRQYHAVRKIGRHQLAPTDLVFYYPDLHHVGIYIGGDRIIHAPSEGKRVRVDLIDHLPVRGYGRVQ
jgi:cell wall-associated NlpC family hydrolase